MYVIHKKSFLLYESFWLLSFVYLNPGIIKSLVFIEILSTKKNLQATDHLS